MATLLAKCILDLVAPIRARVKYNIITDLFCYDIYFYTLNMFLYLWKL